MGLLDPQTLGLLMAAGAGMEASGPSRMPVSTGQVISRGLLGGMQGYQQGVQNQQRGQLFDAQMSHMKMQEEMQRDQLEQQRIARQQALALQQARAGIFGDPGVSPQMALANGGGPTQANADMIRPPNPMGMNPMGAQRFLMTGGDPKVIEAFQNLGPQGQLGKIDPKDYTTDSFRAFMAGGGPAALVPVRKREAIEAMGADGSPETRFIDPYADNGPIAKPVRREAVNSGGRTDFVNPYTQTSPLARTVTPDAVLGANVTMRGQNMTDARAGQTYDADRGMVVDTRGGTARPVMTDGATPLGPKPEKLGEAAVKQINGVNNLKNAITDYRAALKDFSITDAMTPNGRAMMGTKYNNMMLQAKEAYNLGVLNGPDYTILQSVVRDPTSGMGMVTSKTALDTQAKELARIMTKVGETTAASTKTPKAGTDRRPPQVGAVMDGYRFKGGDPASPSNWVKQ